jgi:pyrimidine-nucleoside phosphorylase
LLLAGKAETITEAKQLAADALDDGRALAKFREMVAAQGGNVAQIDNPDLLPQAKYVEDIVMPREGYISNMDTSELGWASVDLGGGRRVKTDTIDPAVGFTLTAKIGDPVSEGQVIGAIHANDLQKLEEARKQILEAIEVSDMPVEALPHFYGVVS